MLSWVHEISQSALAAAVLTLGLVILLELRSIARLRRAIDGNLERVFEQLDLLRFESQLLIEAQSKPVARQRPVAPVSPGVVARSSTEAAIVATAYQKASQLAGSGAPAEQIAERCGLPAGEARLLSSIAAARARRAGG